MSEESERGPVQKESAILRVIFGQQNMGSASQNPCR